MIARLDPDGFLVLARVRLSLIRLKGKMQLNKLWLVLLFANLPLQAADRIKALPSLNTVVTIPSDIARNKFGEVKQMQSTFITTQKLELHKQGIPREILTQKLELHRFNVPDAWQTGKLELHKKMVPDTVITVRLELHRRPSLVMPLQTGKIPTFASPATAPIAPAGITSASSQTSIQLPKPAEGNILIKPMTQTAQPAEINKINPANSLINPNRIKPKNLNAN